MDTIIELDIKKAHLTKAQKKYEKIPKEKRENGYNSKSCHSGDFLLHSILSEYVVSEFLGKDAKVKNTNDYDIVCNYDKIDVKTKPNSDKPPQSYWNASIPAYQLSFQKCDGYVFVRINRDLTKLWITGIISKEDFKKHSRYAKAGSKDGKWVWPANSYYIKLNKLHPISLYKEGKYALQ